MISQITIQNFGLIDRVELELCPSLNILTGETGAGKSIVIDALRFALGERFEPSLARDASKPCIVEVVFELANKELRQSAALSQFLTESDDPLIISRTYLPEGKSRIRINGMAVTVAQLKEAGDDLVDFHGPNDHQMLLDENSHKVILDRLAGIDDTKIPYSAKYKDYRTLIKSLEDLRSQASTRDRELDLLGHQIKELERVTLDASKYNELSEKQARLSNAAELHDNASSILDLLENQDSGVSEAISQAFGPMKILNSLDQSTANFADTLDQIQELNAQLSNDVRSYLDSLSFEPGEARDINARCDMYEEIKRKYGPTIEDAKAFYEKAKKQFELLFNLEHNDKELREKISAVESELEVFAKRMTTSRKKTAASLEDTIERELKELGIKNVRFECRIEKADIGPDGRDKVVFYISPNAGIDLKPLAEIVSSGEAARVMLALKKALTKVDPIPVLIFDEIDSQIGGRLGSITGRKLKELSRDRQVILITHLPQIASFADLHFKISKKVENGLTGTAVKRLDEDSRIQELAKMMSGENETTISIAHAKQMLQDAK
jgi:DNA repair protein RecN (Recombination protein N)